MSADAAPTVVEAVWALFPSAGSAVLENAVAVLLRVPVALAFGLTVSFRACDALAVRLLTVQVSVPVPPTVGVVVPQFQLPGESRKNGVWFGMVSVTVVV